MAKLLGCRGADVNLRGKSGSTAFDIANMLGEPPAQHHSEWQLDISSMTG